MAKASKRALIETCLQIDSLIFSQVVPEILLPKNSEKAKKTWKSLCKKKKTNWNPKDHELFGKLDLWLRFHFVYFFFA